MGLNGGDQSVTIDLPKPLHTGSSVTTDEYPYVKVNIPSPTPEDQDHAILPLGKVHATIAVLLPRTNWKPRITLRAEVSNLIDCGMTDDYNHESEHSPMAEEPTTRADTLPPMKTEVSALPLDTSSQVSTEGTEASIESNPIGASPTAVAHSSHSNSPTSDIAELQVNADLAVNHMLSVKRSSELERQRAIGDFEASLHWQDAEEVAANERAKVVPSRRDLQARVKCAKVVMRAKYEYRVAVQDARTVRCSKLEESEATYMEALRENAAARSL